LFAEDPRRGATQICRLLAAEESAWASVSRTTLSRHLRAAGLYQDRSRLEPCEKFESEHPNQLWQGDILHGPEVQFGTKLVTAKVVCWLDDHSRYICHIEAFANEQLPVIEAALTKAIAKCGRPRSILVDNGKVYSSKTLMMACSVLGIQKIHSRPYHPQSKGKQERLFRTLRSQLLNEVENLEPISLDRLNSLLHAWAEQYHLQEHSEFQDRETPASRYAGVQIDNVPRELLEEAFLQWTQRRVSKQGVIEFSGNKYCVDASLAGSNVVVRYNPFDLSRIYI